MNGADDRASTTNTPAVQCRGLLAGAAALSDAGDDAELIRLGRDFASRHQAMLELAARHDDAVVPIPTDLATAAGAMHAVAEAMAEVPGRTLSGLRAKAGVLLCYAEYDSDGSLMWTSRDELLGWSIARDLLGDAAPPATDWGARP